MAVTYRTIDGPQWQWTETYVFAKANYLIACPADRRGQVGMGVSLLGPARGEKLRFSGEARNQGAGRRRAALPGRRRGRAVQGRFHPEGQFADQGELGVLTFAPWEECNV